MNRPSLEAQREFYDEFFSTRPSTINQHATHRLAKILSAMVQVVEAKDISSRRICDLGCGVGWLANVLRSFGEVTGVDMSPKGIAEAKRRWPGVTFEAANILDYVPREPFDLVVSSEVIEHIEDQEAFIEKVSSLLVDQGFFIVTCPNGLAQRYFKDELPSNQPLEVWPTPRGLRALVSPKFRILRHETFFFSYSNRGLLRAVNSYKLGVVLKGLGVQRALQSISGDLNLGLYQILLARKL